jgi:hypothetical protein
MTIIQNQKETDKAILKCCQKFMKRFEINQLLRKVNASKEKGVLAADIFSLLLALVFSGKNLYVLLSIYPEKISFGKDTVYRFLNKASTNWHSFIKTLSCCAILQIDRLTDERRLTALIIDDSPYYRNRSKKVEMLSRCYDHVQHKFYKGLSLLTLGWSDGQSFVPVDFRLVGASDDKNLLQGSFMKEDKRTLATKRRIDARKQKPALVLEMLQSLKDTVAQAKYVLFDSWFASPSSILGIKGLGYDVVTRLKNHENHLYLYQNEKKSISQIYRASKKRRGRARYLLDVQVQVLHKNFSNTITARVIYVRDRANRKKWIALLSTEISLNAEEIIALYGKRWDIETFFKVIKSHLHLEIEFQTRSFDAMTAHTAIVMTRYIMLSIEERENKDDRTIGELFYLTCKELEDISFSYAFELLLESFKNYLFDYLHLSKERIASAVSFFIAQLPAFLKFRLAVLVCES